MSQYRIVLEFEDAETALLALDYIAEKDAPVMLDATSRLVIGGEDVVVIDPSMSEKERREAQADALAWFARVFLEGTWMRNMAESYASKVRSGELTPEVIR